MLGDHDVINCDRELAQIFLQRLDGDNMFFEINIVEKFHGIRQCLEKIAWSSSILCFSCDGS